MLFALLLGCVRRHRDGIADRHLEEIKELAEMHIHSQRQNELVRNCAHGIW